MSSATADLSYRMDLSAKRAPEPLACARSATSFTEPSRVPVWLTIPCWYLVASRDHAIPLPAERATTAGW